MADATEAPTAREIACEACHATSEPAGNAILVCGGCGVGRHQLCCCPPLADAPGGGGAWLCAACEDAVRDRRCGGCGAPAARRCASCFDVFACASCAALGAADDDADGGDDGGGDVPTIFPSGQTP